MFLNNRGFTLVEVMVASVILFSVVAVGALGLRTAFDSMTRISAVTHSAKSLPDVIEVVKSQLLKGTIKGSGRVDEIVSFSFVASLIKSQKNIISKGNLFNDNIQYGTYDLSLYAVELELYFDIQGKKKKRKYTYKELIWAKSRF